MTPWGAISDLERRIYAIEDALGALEWGGTFRDPRTRPFIKEFYELRQSRLKTNKKPPIPERPRCSCDDFFCDYCWPPTVEE